MGLWMVSGNKTLRSIWFIKITLSLMGSRDSWLNPDEPNIKYRNESLMLSLILTFLPWKPSKGGRIARDSSAGKAVNLREIFISQSRWKSLKEKVIQETQTNQAPQKISNTTKTSSCFPFPQTPSNTLSTSFVPVCCRMLCPLIMSYGESE